MAQDRLLPASLILRHLSIPQDIHTLGLRLKSCPRNNRNHYKALFLPQLSPVLHNISGQPISSRKLTFILSPDSFHIMASKSLQSGVTLSQYAGRFHVITNNRAGEDFFLSLHFDSDPLTESGCSTLAAIAETAPALLSVDSLTLKGELEMAVALSEWGWSNALRHVRVAEYLELELGGAIGLVLRGDAAWISQNHPATLCLRDITLDTETGFPIPEDFEESQEETFRYEDKNMSLARFEGSQTRHRTRNVHSSLEW